MVNIYTFCKELFFSVTVTFVMNQICYPLSEWVCEWEGMGGNNFMPAMLNTAATVLNKTQCIPIWKVVWIVNTFVCFFGWCCCCFFREMLESYEKSVKSILSKSVIFMKPRHGCDAEWYVSFLRVDSIWKYTCFAFHFHCIFNIEF